MAATVTVTPNQVRAGAPLTFAATGFAPTHAITLAVTGPDASFIFHDSATTDGTGAFTWTNEIEASHVGSLAYSITDGTSTVQGNIQIWS